MPTSGALAEVLASLFDRPRLLRRGAAGQSLPDLVAQLLAVRSETAATQIAEALLSTYQDASQADCLAFFHHINDDLDIDAGVVAALAGSYAADPTPKAFAALQSACEPARQTLFRRLNEAQGGTGDIVRMRADLRVHLRDHPALARTDHDFVHLLSSWFNRGFLVLRQITWDSPASVLEKIIAYEAVHEITTWDDLRRRLHPTDRRCFAFFHPAMPDEPLIFVEIALARGIPASIQDVLADGRDVLAPTAADTAVFYSISNCQTGLAGIYFGNSLIKRVVTELSRDLPNIKTFVTLSPVPGLTRWMAATGIDGTHPGPEELTRLAAHYLLNEKTDAGAPLDPVARFHLGNGAMLHAVHAGADTSQQGQKRSMGVMVNYLYDQPRITQNLQAFEATGHIAASGNVRTAARQGTRLVPAATPA